MGKQRRRLEATAVGEMQFPGHKMARQEKTAGKVLSLGSNESVCR